MPFEEKRILIVEDNADNAELLQNQLRFLGYPTSAVASTGPDALRMAKDEAPDLILMDVSLPGMNGLDVARKLKADPGTRTIPILAVTAMAMPGDRKRCLDSGCDGYLSKPFWPSALKREIERLLKRSD